ncbi:hypothetical protein H9L10_02805 [Phycicoccus endophyticus]|uniref:Uncharacterized protein n=1 Tax=Phycicoccus endophyticus TaxID=1690220 RepID=A0A7G9R350_9MICO|nr:hypothetical protein [Phycicoccus endophyticus]NHI20320.1 hypothetical protein [Phycicoccus endophyticus]QNN50025.1 hypothetical protein H9L10_02805 [Phycicoccus endophyticus]GGL28776.1 hypothetical protein GCM10012283_08760 [Phycicoccus endophyticus]
MTPEPSNQDQARADQAQRAADEHEARRPAEQWRAEAEDIAQTQRGALARAEAMGEPVEPIPVPDPEGDPGAVEQRTLDQARRAAAGKRDAEHG